MRLFVISNRGPFGANEEGELVRSSGSFATALDSVLTERNGTWIWPLAPSDAARAQRQSDLCAYDCAFVEVPPNARAGFYDGFSKSVLWPLMHGSKPKEGMGVTAWDDYVTANRAFAATTSAKVGEGDVAWVHDYHLMLVPELLRLQQPRTRLGWFCHAPWPSPELFELLPQRNDIIRGLLGADVVGFHTDTYAEHFLRCVDRLTDAEVDLERRLIARRGRLTRVIVAPVGIDVGRIARAAARESCAERAESIRHAVGDRRVILGVDRLDRTNGIIERLRAYARWLGEHPRAKDDYVLMQLVLPSPAEASANGSLREDIERLVDDINGRLSSTEKAPIHYLYGSLEREELVAHYRSADIALVTPLRDGMNLVAQEFVASRVNDDGVLVLSEHTGAAEHLHQALEVDPYDIAALAKAIDRATRMRRIDERWRMQHLKTQVAELDVHRWAANFLARLRDGEMARPPRPADDRRGEREAG